MSSAAVRSYGDGRWLWLHESPAPGMTVSPACSKRSRPLWSTNTHSVSLPLLVLRPTGGPANAKIQSDSSLRYATLQRRVRHARRSVFGSTSA